MPLYKLALYKSICRRIAVLQFDLYDISLEVAVPGLCINSSVTKTSRILDPAESVQIEVESLQLAAS